MASIAEVIRQNHDEILQLWLEQARKAASARGLTQPELTNMMPVYLSLLVRPVPGQPDVASDRRRELVEGHIGWRLRQGFHLGEATAEFAFLGPCIAQLWSRLPPEEQPENREVQWLYTELGLAMTAVTELFQEHMSEDEQTEKRYTRLLRAMGDQALRTPEASLRERLEEAISLVMNAMGAQTASLLLYEPQTNQLVTTASVGMAHGEFEKYVTSRAAPSFVSRTAAREEPTFVADAETTTLEVGDTLRRSGIHGLLGVRLPPRFKLMGVIYVGISERRAFTAREGRRLESLSEQLTLYLDNVHLYKSLRQQAEDLRIERDLRELFVSVLAHDLRGPLSSVRASAQLLLRQPDKPEAQRELVSRIDRNVRRMDRLIRDLLDASRVQVGGQLPLRLDTCDLVPIAREVVDELRALHGDRFVLQADSAVLGIWSGEELERALWNLAVNAVKYGTRDRPITLSVKGNGEGAWFSVHNDGPVIAREDQAQLFEPFSRARSTQASEGWGLGLFLVRSCAQAHGGKVRVESEAATGTTFTVELPWDARAYQPRDSEEEPRPAVADASGYH